MQVDMEVKSEPSVSEADVPVCPDTDLQVVVPKHELASSDLGGLVIHGGNRAHECRICGRQFADKLTLRMHRREHETEKCFPCNICGKLYSYHSALIAHKKTHLGNKQFKCDLCHCEFYYQSALCAHRKTHSIANLYDCNICGKVFFYQSSLCAHRKIHTSPTPNTYTCELCGKSFSWLSGLCAHRKNYHQTGSETSGTRESNGSVTESSAYPPRPTKKHKCLTCGKVFSWQSGLCAHRRKQHPELYTNSRLLNMPSNPLLDPSAIANINADIATVMNGSNRMTTATTTNPLTCEICRETFPNRVELVTHKIRHQQGQSTNGLTGAINGVGHQNMESLHQMLILMNTRRMLAANAFTAAYSGALFPFNPVANYAAMAQMLSNSMMQTHPPPNGVLLPGHSSTMVPRFNGDVMQAMDLTVDTSSRDAVKCEGGDEERETIPNMVCNDASPVSQSSSGDNSHSDDLSFANSSVSVTGFHSDNVLMNEKSLNATNDTCAESFQPDVRSNNHGEVSTRVTSLSSPLKKEINTPSDTAIQISGTGEQSEDNKFRVPNPENLEAKLLALPDFDCAEKATVDSQSQVLTSVEGSSPLESQSVNVQSKPCPALGNTGLTNSCNEDLKSQNSEDIDCEFDGFESLNTPPAIIDLSNSDFITFDNDGKEFE